MSFQHKGRIQALTKKQEFETHQGIENRNSFSIIKLKIKNSDKNFSKCELTIQKKKYEGQMILQLSSNDSN